MRTFRFWILDRRLNLKSKILNLNSQIILSLGLALCLSLIGAQFVVPFLGNAAEWPQITERGYLIVAVKDNLRPLGFRNSDGELQGLEIDIAHRLAEELLGSSDAVELQPVSNENRLAVVWNGEVDLAIAKVTATPVRARVVSFSPPYYIDSTALVTKAPLSLQTNFAGKIIAVLNGSSTIAVVRYRLPEAQLVGVNSYQEAYSLLESGRAIAFAADASVLAGWVQEYPQYSLLPIQLSTEPLAVVMPKGRQYAQLRQRVNEAIAQAQASGWLLERAQYWGLPIP